MYPAAVSSLRREACPCKRVTISIGSCICPVPTYDCSWLHATGRLLLNLQPQRHERSRCDLRMQYFGGQPRLRTDFVGGLQLERIAHDVPALSNTNTALHAKTELSVQDDTAKSAALAPSHPVFDALPYQAQ